MIRSFALFILAFFSLANLALAQDEDEVSGRTGIYQVLDIVSSPRAAALGNSFVAMKDDPNTLFSNPAALATLTVDSMGRRHKIAVGFLKHVLDINEGYISYATPTDTILGISGGFGAGVQYIDYGSFDGYDTKGEGTGDFGAGELAVSFGYGGDFRSIHFGLAAKFISSSLVRGSEVQDFSSMGGAIDAGLFYEYEPLLMTFGVSALNIGTQFSTYAGVDESLPFNLQLGISKKLERLPLTLHLAFRRLSRDREGRGILYGFHDFSIGGEFVLGKVVRLRFGYENQKRRDLKVPAGVGLAGFSVGTGLNFKQYTVDVAYSSQGHAFAPFIRMGGSAAF